MYSLDKYKYYIIEKENGIKQIIAVSTYAGHAVRGVATCDPADEYSLENGKKLAAYRCGLKVAKKRLARATAKQAEAAQEFEARQKYLDRMNKYLADSEIEYDEVKNALDSLLETL